MWIFISYNAEKDSIKFEVHMHMLKTNFSIFALDIVYGKFLHNGPGAK